MAVSLTKLEVKQSTIPPESNNELKKTISSVSCGNSDSGIEDNADDQISPIATNSNQQKQNQNGIRRRGSIWNIFSRKSKKDHRFGENRNLENLNIANESRYQKSQNVDLSSPPSSHQQKLRPKLSICSTSTNSSIAGHGQISSRLSHGSATIGSFTSDLGDSVPSTPVSTISSAGFTEIPGTIGLHNLGNTCYFNAVIQCLSHIDVISEYFVMEHFMADLTTRNHHNHSLKMRHRQHSDSNNNDLGQLTYMIGLLIKSICFGENYTRQLLEEVLEVVRFHNRSYNINEQQDAQEIFMWLINQIHSESCSNTAPKRRSIKSKDIKKKKQSNEEEQAVASFASFTKYKQSYIQGLFLSQYQSSIPCLRCGKSSSTFDPYINLSLEIPSKPKSVLYTTVISRKQTSSTVPVTNKTIGNLAVTIKPPRMVRYGFEFQRKGTLHELRTEIVDQSGIQDFVIVDITTHGVKRILQNDNPLSILPNDEKSLYAVELSKDVHKSDEAETRANEIVLVVSNVERRNRTNISFGEPSVLRVSDQMSFKRLQTLIRKQMETNLQEHLTKVIKENPICLGLRIVNNNNDDSQSVNTKPIFLKNDVGYPLLQTNILESMTYDDNIQKTCLYLVAEWESSANHWFMSKFRYPFGVTNDKSCSRMRERANEQFVVDIHDCLKLQTKEEKLMEVGAWKCQFCQQEQSGITKKMSLWSLPDVLVLHLKRFDQIQTFKDKARTLVRFPIHGLDLSSYVATTTSSKDQTELLDSRFQKESIRLRYQAPPQNESQCLYDLKAVCNHIGSDLNQGHYTASCYNSFNRNWYNFDDRTVNSLSENEVVNSDAYILFYQRRELSDRVPEKVSMSLRNKERSKRIQDHWATEDIDKVE